jgi:hypothetical protein
LDGTPVGIERCDVGNDAVFCRIDGGLVCICNVVVCFYVLPRGILDFEEVLGSKGALVVQDMEFGLVSIGFKISVDAGEGLDHSALLSRFHCAQYYRV